ncbi:MAG: A/G-specific adenine glycosylase [Burkholderiales bacterium]|nr:MAG: A/G-specific adenine glycosylase [Burkholderiales bacterium]
MQPRPSRIGAAIVRWQRSHGRHALPWQGTRDPYRIWVSEIMLQQTQVAAVIPFYERFVARLPDVRALAEADLDAVLGLWSGLGYYGRARNMYRCAQQIVQAHGGSFPRSAEALAALPGIGRSTAAAIAVFAFGERAAILDGNVKRVLARRFGVDGYPGTSAVQRRLWALAEQQLPVRDVRAYTQGLMDLGATVCTRVAPRCESCPLARGCVARIEARTGELPHPRPARSVPERAVAMLMIECGDRLLLERRPPEGVWGGLWSLPEIPLAASSPPAREDAGRPPGRGRAGADRFAARRRKDRPAGERIAAPAIAAAVASRFGLRVKQVEPLEPFRHAFTHFRLHVEPWRVAAEFEPQVREPGALWLEFEEAMQAALPQPVRRLLQAHARACLRAPGAPAESAATTPGA